MDMVTKAASETKLYTFDFSPELADDETLAEGAIVVQSRGLPLLTEELTIDGVAVVSPLAQAAVSGGTAGEVYVLECSCGTSSGQVLTVYGGVAVK